jgi:hypothetical protein
LQHILFAVELTCLELFIDNLQDNRAVLLYLGGVQRRHDLEQVTQFDLVLHIFVKLFAADIFRKILGLKRRRIFLDKLNGILSFDIVGAGLARFLLFELALLGRIGV